MRGRSNGESVTRRQRKTATVRRLSADERRWRDVLRSVDEHDLCASIRSALRRGRPVEEWAAGWRIRWTLTF
jgi:hypothetical protein